MPLACPRALRRLASPRLASLRPVSPRPVPPRLALPALALACALVAVTIGGCQTLREVSNLRKVDFRLDRVAQPALAGIDLRRVRSYSDLSPGDVLRLTRAVAQRDMPFTFNLVLDAENPQNNSTNARLVKMDWRLFLDDRETISGTFDDEILLPPGQPRDVTIPVQLDLINFFDRGARDVLELALAVAGQNGSPKRIRLEAQPTIDTALGPIRYPRPITVGDTEVGS